MNNERVLAILHDAKALAREYYQLTGKPLGVAGEVAEYEATRLLGVELGPARQAGYDAVEQRNGATAEGWPIAHRRATRKPPYFPAASN